MKKFNPSFTGNLHPHPATVLPAQDPLADSTPPPPPTVPSRPPPSNPSPTIRTTGREYANPVDYVHPFDSMARFAEFLALHYDANRTRHAYYRQLRLIHEHLQCDPATITEAQLRDYFLFVKLKKHWQPKSIRQAAAAAHMFFSDLLQRPNWTVFSQIRTRDHDRLPAVLIRLILLPMSPSRHVASGHHLQPINEQVSHPQGGFLSNHHRPRFLH